MNGTILLVAESVTSHVECNFTTNNIQFWTIQYNTNYPDDIKFQPVIVKDNLGLISISRLKALPGCHIDSLVGLLDKHNRTLPST